MVIMLTIQSIVIVFSRSLKDELNKDKKPLSPCHESVARKLLKDGKAVIHKKYPFTIRLKDLKKLKINLDFG